MRRKQGGQGLMYRDREEASGDPPLAAEGMVSSAEADSRSGSPSTTVSFHIPAHI